MKRIFHFIFSLILIVSIISCRKEATIWHSDWVIPIFHDTLDLKNFTNDSTLTIQNGFYVLDLKRKVSSIKPSDYVKIPDTLIEQKFAISFPLINVPPGISFITKNDDIIFNLDDIELKKTRIKEGKIFVEVLNPLQTTAIFQIEFPSVTSNNQTIKKMLEVAPGTTQNPYSKKVEIDISGYFMDMTGKDGLHVNALPSNLLISTDPNGNTVQMTWLDTTRFKIQTKGIVLDYARGYFGQHSISDSYSFVSEFLKNQVSGLIDLPNIFMNLNFKNGIKVSAKANLTKLENTNSDNGTTIPLVYPMIGNPFTMQTATGSWDNLIPYEKNFVLDENNSNIEHFIENLGEKTKIDYNLELNPWGNISNGWDEFFPNSSFDVNLHIQMPLNVGLNNLVLSDTFDVNFKQDYEKTQIESGTLHLKIENAFPLDGKINLIFLNEFDQFIAELDDIEKISSSVYGSTNSFGILSSKSNINIPLNQDILLKLNELKKIYISIQLNTPNNLTDISEQVSIPEKAFFKVNAQASFKLENHLEK